MQGFKEFIKLQESGSRTGASKTLNYPSAYGAMIFYPPQDLVTHAADFITYLSQDKRFFDNGESAPWPITQIPGKPSHPPTANANNGEGTPFSIKHIPRSPIIKFKYDMPD